MKCPDCGYIKKMSFMNLVNKGFGCNECSDGIKYPNKFMMELLKQLKVEFECEYSPEWIKPKRYDFYIPSKKILIEFQGKQHYGAYKNFGGEKSFKKLKKHDKIKKEYCKNNEYFLLEIPYFKIEELNKILEEQVGTNKN